jgi:hypothetical protein
MFLAILHAAFIYGLIWMFERKRRKLHEFDFDMIAVVPPFVYFGLSMVTKKHLCSHEATTRATYRM